MGCSGFKAAHASTAGQNTAATLLQASATTTTDATKISESAALALTPKAEDEKSEKATDEEADPAADSLSPKAVVAPVDVELTEAAREEQSDEVPSLSPGLERSQKQPCYKRAQTCPPRAMNGGSRNKVGIQETVETNTAAEQACDEPAYGGDPITAGPDPTQGRPEFAVNDQVAWASKGVWKTVGKIQSCDLVDGEYFYEVVFTERYKLGSAVRETNTVEWIPEEDLVKVDTESVTLNKK